MVRDSLLPPLAPLGQGELLVMADEATSSLVGRELAATAIKVLRAEELEQAIVVAAERASTLDGVLVDMELHGPVAWQLIEQLKQDELTASIPVMAIVAGSLPESDLLRLIDAGVTEQLVRPISPALLSAKVRAVTDRSRVQRELKLKLNRALECSAQDALTGLFNRRYFERRLREETEHAKRHKRPFSLIVADLDQFKQINDSFGHAEGDRVLCHVADLLSTSLREEDVLCRFGGEEFVVLLRATPGAAARLVANRIREALEWAEIPLVPGSITRTLTLSAGVASADDKNDFDSEHLLDRADKALYRAKRAGRNRIEME